MLPCIVTVALKWWCLRVCARGEVILEARGKEWCPCASGLISGCVLDKGNVAAHSCDVVRAVVQCVIF